MLVAAKEAKYCWNGPCHGLGYHKMCLQIFHSNMPFQAVDLRLAFEDFQARHLAGQEEQSQVGRLLMGVSVTTQFCMKLLLNITGFDGTSRWQMSLLPILSANEVRVPETIQIVWIDRGWLI